MSDLRSIRSLFLKLKNKRRIESNIFYCLYQQNDLNTNFGNAQPVLDKTTSSTEICQFSYQEESATITGNNVNFHPSTVDIDENTHVSATIQDKEAECNMLSQSSVIPNISPNSSFTEEDRSSDSDEVYITNWLKLNYNYVLQEKREIDPSIYLPLLSILFYLRDHLTKSALEHHLNILLVALKTSIKALASLHNLLSKYEHLKTDIRKFMYAD